MAAAFFREANVIATSLRRRRCLRSNPGPRFMGGREPWKQRRAQRAQIGAKAPVDERPWICIETVENKKRSLAIELIRNAFDRNRDGKLDERERSSIRLILYGQSFGGAAVVKLARQLKKMDVPVFLTVQVDSIGRGDRVIPPNVAHAANLFQGTAGLFGASPRFVPKIRRGLRSWQLQIRLQSQADRRVKGSIDEKAFRVAHTRMEYDPDVWRRWKS